MRSRGPWPARAARAARRSPRPCVERERPRLEIEPAGFDLGEIQDLLDQRQQRVARGLHRLGVGGLFGRQRRVEQQLRHAEDAVQRRADLVRDHREEAPLGAVGRLGLVARLGERVFALGAVGDVAADALDLAHARGGIADRDVAPGDPARAIRRGDLLVVHARAVRQRRDRALFEQRQRNVAADQRPRAEAGKAAKRIVRIG